MHDRLLMLLIPGRQPQRRRVLRVKCFCHGIVDQGFLEHLSLQDGRVSRLVSCTKIRNTHLHLDIQVIYSVLENSV